MDIFVFVKSRVSILQVVQEYVSLKRAGLYWKGRCPFHDEKTASFTVSPHREIFYCFGCHKGGDIVAFVSETERCTPLESVQHIIERFGLEVPSELLNPMRSGDFSQNIGQQKRYNALHEAFLAWAHKQLFANQDAHDYVISRGFNPKSMRDFLLGYVPEKKIQQLLSHIKDDGFVAKDLIDARLLIEGKGGLYSPFAERIIFPIRDQLGRLCGFGGRVFHKNDQRPKYYNSPEHEFFNKGTLLFGLDRAKKAIQAKRSAFLVEGYFDCLAMMQAGYENTVATLGTACTVEHLKLLSRYAENIYFLYDGDLAGQEAMVKIAQMTWAVNIEPYVVCLPAKDDPASLLQKDGTALLDVLIERAQDIFSFVVRRFGESYYASSMQERIALVKDVVMILGSIQDTLKKNVLLQKAAVIFQIPYQLLYEQTERISQTHANSGKITRALSSNTESIQEKPQEKSQEKSVDKSIDNVSSEYEKVKIQIHEALLFFALLTESKDRIDHVIKHEDEHVLLTGCQEPVRLLISKFLIYNKSNKNSENIDRSNQKSPEEKNQNIKRIPFLDDLTDHERLFGLRLFMYGEQLVCSARAEEAEEIDVANCEWALERLVKIFWKKYWKRFMSTATAQLKMAQETRDLDLIKRISQKLIDFKEIMRKKDIL